jgi:hypothetical protein
MIKWLGYGKNQKLISLFSAETYGKKLLRDLGADRFIILRKTEPAESDSVV